MAFEWSTFAEFFDWGVVVGSFTLGLMFGAFYGWDIVGRRTRPFFPRDLWILGEAAILTLLIYGALVGTFTVEAGVARGVAWTLVCIGIPTGRWCRLRLALWRLKRKSRKVKEGNDAR